MLKYALQLLLIGFVCVLVGAGISIAMDVFSPVASINETPPIVLAFIALKLWMKAVLALGGALGVAVSILGLVVDGRLRGA